MNICQDWLSKNGGMCTHNLGGLGYCACAKHYDPEARRATGLAAPLTKEEAAEAERRMRIAFPELLKDGCYWRAR